MQYQQGGNTKEPQMLFHMPLPVILPHAMNTPILGSQGVALGDGQWLLADLWSMQVFRDRLPLEIKQHYINMQQLYIQ